MRPQKHKRILWARAALCAVWAAAAFFVWLLLPPHAALAARTVTLPVEVAFDGSALPTETFRIALAPEGGEETVREVALDNTDREGSAEFSLALETGIYSYTLREIAGETQGVVYSGRVFSVTVAVNADGTYAVTASDTATGQKPDRVRFDNTYTGPRSVIGDPPVPVQKRISGDDPGRKDTFVFSMIPEREGDPLPEGAAGGRKDVTIRGEGEAEFGEITFSEPGVYRYRVAERDGGIAGYTYDRTEYTVVYTVTEGSGGVLTCDRVIVKNLETVNACVFTNEYRDPGKGVTPPRTGDSSHVLLYAFLTGLCAAVILLLLVRRRREAREET
ncbi:MAG: hypothetical protein IJL66_02425 [Lachnospiraceae bacterium]|nr:hypothetical protein [Lachnospiraceae bacterium]